MSDSTKVSSSDAAKPSHGSASAAEHPTPSTSKPSAGAQQAQSTAIFRALNPELFIRPNIIVMSVGVISVSVCVAYIAYINATKDSRKPTYMAMSQDGTLQKREKHSKWD